MSRVPTTIFVGAKSAPFVDGVSDVGGLDVRCSLSADGSGLRLDWSVHNGGRQPARPGRIGVGLPATPRRVVEHGWQSWSAVRVCDPVDVRPARREAAEWERAMLGLDPGAAGWVVCGDQFLVDDSGVTGFLSADGNFGTVVSGSDPDGGLLVWALIDDVVIEPGTSRVLDPVWFGSGDPATVYSEYALRWGERSSARAASPAPFGWCSWYRFGAGVTPSDVRAQVAPAVAHGLEFIQIDDGWQQAVGDWGSFSPAWHEGIAPVAAEIRAGGMRAGIWTAPFLVAERSATAADNPEWLLRDRRGRPVRAMHHPSLWGGWALCLDTTHPGALDHLRTTFSNLVDDGFDVHKIDFLYAGAVEGARHDSGVTRAEALRRGLDTIRSAVGDDAFILGCGCPLAPAVGVVDAMRVSPDAAVWWSQADEVEGFGEATSSAENALRTSWVRAPLHRRLWINDPDCLMLRNPAEQRTSEQRALVREMVVSTGCYTTLSDDLRDYDEDDWRFVAELRALLPQADTPTTVDPFAPASLVLSP
jgi:alpha-galactosidase